MSGLLKTLLNQSIARALTVVSQEAASEAKTEREFVVYGKFEDPEDAAKVAQLGETVYHEQWDIRVEKDEVRKYFGQVRVRKTFTDKEQTYTLCIKRLSEESDEKHEVELEVDQDIFEVVKALSTNGMIKARTKIAVEGEDDLFWEVDVFYPNGFDKAPGQWVKLDLEVPSFDREIPELPIKLTEVLDTQPKDRSEEQRQFVSKLLEEHFLQQNPFTKRENSDEESEAL